MESFLQRQRGAGQGTAGKSGKPGRSGTAHAYSHAYCAANTVPGACEFRVDVRFTTQAEFEETKAYLQKITDTVYVPGCSCTMEQTNLRPAMELTDKNLTLLEKANTLFTQNGLSRLEIGMRTGGSDAADVTCFGIPCIDSIGVGGERAHSPEEYGIIDSLAESAKRIATIVCGL